MTQGRTKLLLNPLCESWNSCKFTLQLTICETCSFSKWACTVYCLLSRAKNILPTAALAAVLAWSMLRSHRLAICLLLIKVSPWLCTERLSNAVFVSYGSGASSAARLLLKELVISKGANISAHLTTVYLGGPPLAPDLGPFGIVVFDPLPMVSLFWGCGSLHPQIQHMDPAFQVKFLFLRWNLLTFFGKVHSPLLWLTSSCAVRCIHSHITPFFIWLQWSDV